MTDLSSRNDPTRPPGGWLLARDAGSFPDLDARMTECAGGSWHRLSFAEARGHLDQAVGGAKTSDAEPDLIALALDRDDTPGSEAIDTVIALAVARGIDVILVVDGVSPQSLHRLLQKGVRTFVPYPVPDGALSAAILGGDRDPAMQANSGGVSRKAGIGRPSRRRSAPGAVLAVHGLAGGVGATTFAVTLADELTRPATGPAPSICLLDLDPQMGAVATYLDLRQAETGAFLSECAAEDSDAFARALVPHGPHLHVLTAPDRMLPPDTLTPATANRLISWASATFDYVVIDMPSTLTPWTSTILGRANVYFALLQLDMRSSQNALRFLETLDDMNMATDALRFVLNRAPQRADLTNRRRVKQIAESLAISIDIRLPDGGRQVMDGNDQGTPLADYARRNPLRRAIARIADDLRTVGG